MPWEGQVGLLGEKMNIKTILIYGARIYNSLPCPTDWKLVLFFSESRRLLQVVWKIRRGELEVSLGDNICQVKCFD